MILIATLVIYCICCLGLLSIAFILYSRHEQAQHPTMQEVIDRSRKLRIAYEDEPRP